MARFSTHSPPQRVLDAFARIAEDLLGRAVKEAREFGVSMIRHRFGFTGNLLRGHPWAIEYRMENFEPRWDVTVVKRWTRVARAKAKAKSRASRGSGR